MTNIITGGLLQALNSITGDNGRWPLNGLHVNGPRLTASDGRVMCIATFPEDLAETPITVESHGGAVGRECSYVIRQTDPQKGLELTNVDNMGEDMAPSGITLDVVSGQYPDLKHHRNEWMVHKKNSCKHPGPLEVSAKTLETAVNVFTHCGLSADWANGNITMSIHLEPSADEYLYLSAEPEEDAPMTVKKVQLIVM